MKNVTFLVLVLLSVSCSDRIYSYREKVKAEQQQVLRKVSTNEIILASNQPGIIGSHNILSENSITAIDTKTTGVKTHTDKHVAMVTEPSQNIRQDNERKLSVTNQKNNSILFAAKRVSSKKLIVFGLVILLVGFVLSLLSGFVGAFFMFIGGLILIVGLIMYLFHWVL